MSLPPILVLNLERSKDRRQHMEKELGRFGVDYSFFPATDGKKFSKEERKLYSPRQAVAIAGITMADGHIANALSHARIYEKVIKEKIEELLILEDDIYLDDCFFELLSHRREWLPPNWGVVNFAATAGLNGKQDLKDIFSWTRSLDFSNSQNVQLRVGKFKVQHWMASCYLINLHAAHRLLPLMYPIRTLTSRITGDIALHKMDNYTVFPAVVELDRMGSVMGKRRKQKALWESLWIAIRYKDARKMFFKARVYVLSKKCRKLYGWLLRK